jgi:bla regulator protein blaR1
VIPGIVGHLWQSTAFAGAAWLVVLTLRRNRATLRYWVWFAASAKFLIPFSLLVVLGTWMPNRPAPRPVPARLVAAVEQFSQPLAFSLTGNIAVAPKASPSYLAAIALAVWASGFAVVAAFWILKWRHVHGLRRRASPARLPSGVEITAPVMSAPGLTEPGVFGILRPVLLLPEGIAERLDQTQLEAILAHESCHIRRKDNLTAVIHMAVQAVFWFHPLTWWIGARLIDERERACDEEVLSLGYKPNAYAESILSICRLYVESPLACVSGVTGSDLKKRIEAIMKNPMALSLSLGRKLALAAVSVTALALPIAVGILHAQDEPDWQKAAGGKMEFEVASVKPTVGAGAPPLFPLSPDDAFAQTGGRFFAAFPLNAYIIFAYKIWPSDDQRKAMYEHVPQSAWMARYTIEAKAPANATKDQMRLMMQSLLAERFKLAVHFETKEMPVFALTLVKPGKLGPKLIPHEQGPACDAPASDNVFPPNCYANMVRLLPDGVRKAGSRNTTPALLASGLMGPGSLGRPVVDQTGLTGRFDFSLEYAPDPNDPIARLTQQNGGPAPPETGPSFLDAVREQLGLKLESTKAAVRTLIVDHVEAPSEN